MPGERGPGGSFACGWDIAFSMRTSAACTPGFCGMRIGSVAEVDTLSRTCFPISPRALPVVRCISRAAVRATHAFSVVGLCGVGGTRVGDLCPDYFLRRI